MLSGARESKNVIVEKRQNVIVERAADYSLAVVECVAGRRSQDSLVPFSF